MKSLFLTFDVEDYVNEKSLVALKRVLEILEENELRAIFFITGYMAKKLKRYPTIVDLLENHEIGYHSTSHSVRPIIAEYTDIEDYGEAIRIAFFR